MTIEENAAQLDRELSEIKSKLGEKGLKACYDELSIIDRLVKAQSMLSSKHTQQEYQSAINELSELINEIDNEAKAITTEVHGGEIFSAYEFERINQYAYHRELREWLAKVIKTMKELMR